ncbi:acyloxyacyl hydrolase [Negadavirga shengliensis]|uniref:Acyloxyacyl hydrolase n=1 Tax=Negadavirga shengliensis TaxID=1389218 RepID=A0ABV9T081_9BACT
MLLILYLGTHATAQKVSRWTGELQKGIIVAHATDLIPVADSQPFGFRAGFDVLQKSRDAWHACHCHHFLGIDFSYHNFNNREILGSALSLSGAFEPVIWHNKNWLLSVRSGMGISYITRVYDEEFNPDNNFFSSPISFLLFISPKISYKLSERWMSSLTLHYNHISNGGQRQPNRGMNFPTLGIGISYLVRDLDLPDHEAEKASKKVAWHADFFGTMRDDPVNPGRKPSFGVSAGSIYRIGRVNGLGAGAEINWDLAANEISGSGNAAILGTYFSHHFLFGRFDFSQRMTWYIQKPVGYQPDRTFFQRYILSYEIFKGVRVGVGLKTHGHVAENIDFRIGWRK